MRGSNIGPEKLESIYFITPNFNSEIWKMKNVLTVMPTFKKKLDSLKVNISCIASLLEQMLKNITGEGLSN
jgi:CDP-diacylglycerol pyrophosphatase